MILIAVNYGQDQKAISEYKPLPVLQTPVTCTPVSAVDNSTVDMDYKHKKYKAISPKF